MILLPVESEFVQINSPGLGLTIFAGTVGLAEVGSNKTFILPPDGCPPAAGQSEGIPSSRHTSARSGPFSAPEEEVPRGSGQTESGNESRAPWEAPESV